MDKLTFLRSWYNGIRRYPDEQRLAVYDAILAFAFDSIEPAESGGDLTSAIVALTISNIRSTIETSRKRSLAGAIGGSKTEANRKQTESKTEAKRKQNGSKPQANAKQKEETEKKKNQKEKGKKNLEVLSTSSSSAHARGMTTPTISIFLNAGHLAGVADNDWMRGLYAELVEAGWADRDGRPIGNWRRYLKSSWIDFQKKISARASVDNALDEIRDAR